MGQNVEGVTQQNDEGKAPKLSYKSTEHIIHDRNQLPVCIKIILKQQRSLFKELDFHYQCHAGHWRIGLCCFMLIIHVYVYPTN